MKLKLVYAYVCGDILHIGHLTHLLNSKAMGDKLIVGVLTDKAIMEKKQKPIFEFERRMELIRNLKCVDGVIPQNEYSPLTNVKMLNPDILMESESHIDYSYIELLKKEFKGRIIFTPYYNGTSSTDIKNKIKKDWEGN